MCYSHRNTFSPHPIPLQTEMRLTKCSSGLLDYRGYSPAVLRDTIEIGASASSNRSYIIFPISRTRHEISELRLRRYNHEGFGDSVDESYFETASRHHIDLLDQLDCRSIQIDFVRRYESPCYGNLGICLMRYLSVHCLALDHLI